MGLDESIWLGQRYDPPPVFNVHSTGLYGDVYEYLTRKRFEEGVPELEH